jgi:WD40 repeat protein
MTRVRLCLGLACAISVSQFAFALPTDSPPGDQPLPAGAVARLDPSDSKLFGTWGVAFSPDGKTLALGSQEGSFCLWSLDGKGSARQFRGHDGGALAMWFSADGKRVPMYTNVQNQQSTACGGKV